MKKKYDTICIKILHYLNSNEIENDMRENMTGENSPFNVISNLFSGAGENSPFNILSNFLSEENSQSNLMENL